MLTLEKIDFKLKMVKRNKESHHIMVKVWIHQEYITIIKFSSPHIGTGSVHICVQLYNCYHQFFPNYKTLAFFFLLSYNKCF